MQVGFLGLGNMGSAMAGRLVAAGHEVLVWNRSPEAADELVALGATRVNTAAEALAAPISFSMLANDAAAESVLTAEALSGADGRIHVCMASISAAAADRLEAVHRAAGVGYVACPVLGRPAVAAAGGLNLIAAGPKAELAKVTPLLEVLGARVWHFGEEPRRANVAKIAMNFTILHALQAIGEAVTLVEAHGLDATDFTELLSNTLFAGPVYSGYGSMIAERRYSPPGFTMALGLKDLRLAGEAAEAFAKPLPMLAAVRGQMQAAADAGRADQDWSAVAEHLLGR